MRSRMASQAEYARNRESPYEWKYLTHDSSQSEDWL
jgi:hypothetical protein